MIPADTEKPWPSGLPMAITNRPPRLFTIRIAERHKGSPSASTFSSAISVIGIPADDGGGQFFAGKEFDQNLIGAFDDVIVRHDVAIGRKSRTPIPAPRTAAWDRLRC